MKKIVAMVILLTFFVGCGGGSSSSTARDNIGSDINGTTPDTNSTTPDTNSTTPVKEVVQMVVGEAYYVYPGDDLQKLSEDAKVRVTHNNNVDITTVVLIEGSAIINYH